MANEINLSIVLPSTVYLETKVPSVILPAVRADVDILPERAPSVFVLDYGVLQILGREGSVKQRYFIKSGAAEVAKNDCRVLTQLVIPYDEISQFEAKKRKEEAENEDDKLFYGMILDYQRGIRRRYLRTLNIFSDKAGMPITQEELVENIREHLEKLRERFPK